MTPATSGAIGPVFQSALDSGATTNCFPASYRGTNYQPVGPNESILAQVADDNFMTSVARDSLNIPTLPETSREAHLFKEISIPLLSVNKICAGDLAVLFYGAQATVFKPKENTIRIDGTPVLLGTLDKQTELYMVDVHSTPPCTIQGGNNSQAIQSSPTFLLE